MTKTELAAVIAQKLNISRSAAEIIVNAFLDSVEDALALDGILSIRDFGSFKTSLRKERQARNPRTGESVVIPARKTIVFRPSVSLKDLVDGQPAKKS